MQGYNHVTGGVVFTGIFASFHDVNVFEKPLLIGVTVFFSLLPDVDHTRSGIGKTFYPVASFLQTRYGHRTLTHSIFFYLASVGLLLLFPRPYTVCGAYALLSHLLFDMCTRQGVPLMYPFSKRPFVLPANPSLRLSAQDHRSEAIVFVVFLALGMFCRPLMAQGFWTTYNKAFSTWEHVERETVRSPDLLHVVWNDQQKHQHEGLYYRKNVVLTTTGFETVKPAEEPLTSFEHSGLVLTEKQRIVSSVTTDSLNRLLTAHCVRVQIQSSDDLTYYEKNLMQVSKFINLEYRKNLLVSQLPHDDSETENKIKLLAIDREAEQLRYSRELQEYVRQMRKAAVYNLSLQKLAGEFGTASDYRKGQIIVERRETETKLRAAQESEPLPPVPPNVAKYDIELQLLKKQLEHKSTINANLITVSWKPNKKNS
jgi:inner membrane protein